jgi:hypothetical protein
MHICSSVRVGQCVGLGWGEGVGGAYRGVRVSSLWCVGYCSKLPLLGLLLQPQLLSSITVLPNLQLPWSTTGCKRPGGPGQHPCGCYPGGGGCLPAVRETLPHVLSAACLFVRTKCVLQATMFCWPLGAYSSLFFRCWLHMGRVGDCGLVCLIDPSKGPPPRGLSGTGIDGWLGGDFDRLHT